MRIIPAPRRALLRRMLLALGVVGFALSGVTASAPEARAQSYLDCLKGVDDLVEDCLGEDPSGWREYSCKWAGGMGYFACAGGEALKEIAKAFPI